MYHIASAELLAVSVPMGSVADSSGSLPRLPRGQSWEHAFQVRHQVSGAVGTLINCIGFICISVCFWGTRNFVFCIVNVYCGAWRTTSWCALSSCQTEWIYRNWGIWCFIRFAYCQSPFESLFSGPQAPVKRFLTSLRVLEDFNELLEVFSIFQNANRNHLLTWDKSLWAK